jgi:hypothetical protein
MHRFVWDLHYPPPDVSNFTYPISAIYRNTPRTPTGPWVKPGRYTVKLTVNGKSYAQPLTVRMDPRVKTSASALGEQFALSMKLYLDLSRDYGALREVRGMRAQLEAIRKRGPQGQVGEAVARLDEKAAALEGIASGGGGGGRGAGSPRDLAQANATLATVYGMLQGADVAPTTQLVAAVGEIEHDLAGILGRWTALKTADVTALNAQLRQANLPALDPATWKQARADVDADETFVEEDDTP